MNQDQKRIDVDFPAWVVSALDREVARIGVTRQSIIKVWLVERLEAKTVAKSDSSAPDSIALPDCED